MRRFFEEHTLDNNDSLSEDRVKKIRRSVFARIKEEKPMKKHFSLKPMIIAAAITAAAAISTVTVAARFLAPRQVEINSVVVEPGYTVYTDEYNNKVETYVFPVPEEFLTEEVPGRTAKGQLKFGGRYDKNGRFYFVDEEGTEFNISVNNFLVYADVTTPEGYHHNYGLDIANKVEGLCYTMDRRDDDKITIEFYKGTDTANKVLDKIDASE